MNPYVFLVGCPRSGTTLLQRMVDAHPQLAVIHETLWIPEYFEKRKGLTSDGCVTEELIPKLYEHRRFEKLGLPHDRLEEAAQPGAPYASFVTRVFDLYGQARGKELVGDKSPGYVRSIRTLHALFPYARFIHLIRDGRDVALSLIDWKKADKVTRDFSTWRDDPVTTGALWWERSVRLGREAGAQLPSGRYSELRYEELVARPLETSKRICAFLGLEHDDAMIRFHEGRMDARRRGGSKRKWLPPTQGLRDWRGEMTRDEQGRFEAAAGTLLDELGYRRAAPTSRDASRKARATKGRFIADVVTRGRPIPERWHA